MRSEEFGGSCRSAHGRAVCCSGSLVHEEFGAHQRRTESHFLFPSLHRRQKCSFSQSNAPLYSYPLVHHGEIRTISSAIGPLLPPSFCVICNHTSSAGSSPPPTPPALHLPPSISCSADVCVGQDVEWLPVPFLVLLTCVGTGCGVAPWYAGVP